MKCGHLTRRNRGLNCDRMLTHCVYSVGILPRTKLSFLKYDTFLSAFV